MAKDIYFSYQVLIALLFFIKVQEGFFIKHVVTKLCLKPGDNSYTSKYGSSTYFLEFTDNCNDAKAQFRFVNDGYVENIQLNAIIQTDRDRLIVVDPITKLTKDEIWKSFLELKQTKSGSLRLEGCEKKVCATPATSGRPSTGHFVNVTKSCDKELQKFVFGSITCENRTIEDVNCNNKSQGIVIQYAWYGQLRTMDIGTVHARPCASALGSCGGDWTSLFKTQCEKKSSCSLYVMQPGRDSCPKMTKVLYLEYNCAEKQQTKEKNPVDVRLVSSVLPNEGLLQIEMDNISSNVCNMSLNHQGQEVICRQLGYQEVKQARSPAPKANNLLVKFSGKISCSGIEKELSECCFDNATQVEDCTHYVNTSCLICSEPLLDNQTKFPDKVFNSSSSLSNHGAAKARISSNSSWCAPSDGDHFLDIDLGRHYVINGVATFGDSAMARWVSSYKLNYTFDGVKWMELLRRNKRKEIDGNTDAFNNAAILEVDDIQARVLRFIPTHSFGQPCMRVEICGHTVYPDEVNNLTVTNITSTSATVSWDPPLNIGDDNVLSRFQLKLMNIEMKPHVRNFTVNDGKMQFNVTGLLPNREYELKVAAGNKHGYGEESTVNFTTAEGAPSGPPRDVTVVAQNSSSLSVFWKEPDDDKQNGVITSYTICISTSKNGTCFKDYITSNKKFVLLNLNVSTKYYVSVRASTQAGDGIFSSTYGRYTNLESPGNSISATSTTLTFNLVNVDGNFSYFHFVALQLLDEQKPSKSPDSYDRNDLVTYSEASQRSPYIAAIASAAKVESQFVLGDGSNSSFTTPGRRQRRSSEVYYNGPLKAGTSYSVFQRFYNPQKNESISTDWSPPADTGPVPTTRTTGTKSDDDSLPLIIGVVVAAVCAVLLVGVLIVCWCRRSKRSREKSSETVEIGKIAPSSARVNEGGALADDDKTNDEKADDDVVDALQAENQSNKVIENNTENENINERENYWQVSDRLYDNEEVTVTQKPRGPILVSEFERYVHNMKNNSDYNFKKEFKVLPSGHLFNWDAAKRSFNKVKNRYGNIVTYDASRVILSGDEKSDYINASFIDGTTKNYYIATQGPKPLTIDDFWRMVFEHKCPTIVMVTCLTEIGKVKCEKYWPDSSNVYGDIKVTNKDTKEFANHVTRNFILERNDEKHDVIQFHFTNWPDHGVPHYPTQLLSFRRHYKSEHNKRTGPVVVHCSAGVGRTGVFIAVDKIIDDLDSNSGVGHVDVFGMVKGMRKKRMNMVQTAEQYEFIHDAILDHIKCGLNEVDASNLRIEIKKMTRNNPNGETGFEEKFQRLNGVSPRFAIEECEAGLLPENAKKNRCPRIYPCEVSRVYLSPVEDEENSDYINACFVDGYLGKQYFIATQTPLKQTINDFWRMIFEHRSSTILMLNQLKEDGEDYPMFWPTERAKPKSFGTVTLQLDSAKKKDDIIVRKFIISSSPDLKGGRTIKLIQYIGWPDHGIPKNNADVLDLLKKVETSQREADKGPVTVICSDGAGRTGTFIAISNLVDRVKIVQVVDPFQCIKQIRSKRPQFVETAEQFKVCYEVVEAFLSSFNEYSNFTMKEA